MAILAGMVKATLSINKAFTCAEVRSNASLMNAIKGARGHHRAFYLLNASLFSLAHLMYWSWIVAIMTFGGGLLFTWAYRRRGSFFYAVLLHAIAGNIIFAAGLGIYFYSGNVQRPF